MTQAFGEAFERLRLSRALSPAELARELSEYEGNVSRWRRGGGIDVVRVRKIADYFGVDRGWLEGLAGYPASQPTTNNEAVDPNRLERFALVEQVADEDWPSVRKMLIGLAAAANTSGDPTANHASPRVNGRRRGQQPPLKSHLGRRVAAYAAMLILPIWRPRPVLAMLTAAIA